MSGKTSRRVLACVAAVAMLAGAVASPVMSVSAVSQLLGETSFSYKSYPWQTSENNPAEQYFALEDGAMHIKIVKAQGADGEMWDLMFKHK